MTRLDVQRPIPRTQVTLRTPPNWTAICFFLLLAMLHLYMAIHALIHDRPEGFMSWIFGTGFCLIALMCWRMCCEMTLLTKEKRLRLRTGFRRLYVERSVPFSKIRNVRLTLLHPRTPTAAKIELVCDHEVIECPPTCVPREEALCLAMNIDVELIKVYGDAFGPVAERWDQLPPG
jgi:hypothetical protein